MEKNIVVILLVSLVLVSNTVSAKDNLSVEPLVVLEDRGGVPIEKYIPKKNSSRDRMNEAFRSRSKYDTPFVEYPIVSKSLTVGRVGSEEGKDIKTGAVTSPLFIIGDDDVSKQWLKNNSAMLKKKKAIGLVVNVRSNEQMNALQALVGQSVLLQPTNGDKLAQHLKIQHYPFYVDNSGVLR
jgi:integrating conjugative element protein (TIGR03765 family)